MCTKYFNDGDVHKYFSAYERPHDGYIYFGNIITDFIFRIDEKLLEIENSLCANKLKALNTTLTKV
jgi:alpha-amylase